MKLIDFYRLQRIPISWKKEIILAITLAQLALMIITIAVHPAMAIES